MQSLTLAIALLLLPAPLLADPKIEAVPNQSTFPIEYDKATDFSGLTWLEGEHYYTVSNRTNGMFPLNITLDSATGRITDAKFGRKVEIQTDYSDFEGIAWVPETKRLYLSSESANGIVGFDREGDARFSVKVPEIYQEARRNRSLESLTFGADAFWTANENALACDGPESSASHGGVVRLQKFDAQFRPVAQYPYRTETSLVRVGGGGGTGLTDLCALPNGELLALERVVAVGLVAKVFLVDVTGADDTSKLSKIDPEDIKTVRKTLLFERHTLTANFEGIALGPELADGWRSLILIADSGGGSKHLLMPLRIRFDSKKPDEKK
jgi:hypothetical protein